MAKAKEARDPLVGERYDSRQVNTELSFHENKPNQNAHGSTVCQDPIEAAGRLAAQLTDYVDRTDVLVLTLRRGVQVALALASALRAPLDLILVRELCVPWGEVVKIGAIATGGERIIYDEVVSDFRIPDEVVDRATARELRKLKRRERAYRGGRPAPDVLGRTVILVNDGLTKGSMTRAAAMTLRQQQPKEIIVALPYADKRTCETVREQVDRVIIATVIDASLVNEKLPGPARRVLQSMRALRRFRKGSH